MSEETKSAKKKSDLSLFDSILSGKTRKNRLQIRLHQVKWRNWSGKFLDNMYDIKGITYFYEFNLKYNAFQRKAFKMPNILL